MPVFRLSGVRIPVTPRLHEPQSSFPAPYLEKLPHRISAVRQNSNEQILFNKLTAIRIDNVGGLACPVNLHSVSRLVFQVHGGLGFVNIIRVILVELGRFVSVKF